MASDGGKMGVVPKSGFLVFGKSLLPFSGDGLGGGKMGVKWAESCPKIGVSYFKKKGFAEKGTY
jgi:hypothetical protein